MPRTGRTYAAMARCNKTASRPAARSPAIRDRGPQVREPHGVSEQHRRIAIYCFYMDTLDAPPKEDWLGYEGTVTLISRALDIPKGSRASVLRVLEDVTRCHREGWHFTGERLTAQGRGSRPEMQRVKTGSVEEQLIANGIENGCSIANAIESVYAYRSTLPPAKRRSLLKIKKGAVHECVLRLKPKITTIQRSKQGFTDPSSQWARARFRWVAQLMIRFGVLLPIPAPLEPCFDVATPQSDKYMLNVWDVTIFDEIQCEQVIGGVGHACRAHGNDIRVTEQRFLRDATGKLDSVNGTYAPEHTLLAVKYSQESRFLSGARVVRLANGKLEGQRIPLLIYSGCRAGIDVVRQKLCFCG